MAKKSMIEREKKRAKIVEKYAAKREALKAKTGFDVDKAIENDRASKEDDKKETIADKPAERRVTESTPAGRRTSGNAYKVVKQAETKSAE